jgi:hypothetical protein
LLHEITAAVGAMSKKQRRAFFTGFISNPSIRVVLKGASLCVDTAVNPGSISRF